MKRFKLFGRSLNYLILKLLELLNFFKKKMLFFNIKFKINIFQNRFLHLLKTILFIDNNLYVNSKIICIFIK
jgi:hypothetical protein